MSLLKSRFIEMFGDVINNKKTWPTKRWSDVLNIVNGKNQKKVECENGIYPICGSGGKIGKTNEYLTKENSVIIGRKGNINNPILMKTKFWNVDTAFGLEPNNKEINVEYLYKFCELFDFQRLNKTVTIPSLTKSDLLKIEIPVPPMKLQEEYRNFLAQVDKSKFLLQQILKKLELLKKSRFIEMFGDPIKNEKRWAQLTLNSVCDGIGDGLHGTPEYDDSGDFYFINGNNLINGEIVITPSTKKVNEEVFKKYYRNISSNALLLSINGTLGKIAFYNNEAITLGKSACYINLKTFVNKYFVFELMKTDHFLKYLEENSTKSTIKNVSLKTIRNFQLISPPENLQNDFISFSKKIDKSKLIIQKALEDLVGKV